MHGRGNLLQRTPETPFRKRAPRRGIYQKRIGKTGHLVLAENYSASWNLKASEEHRQGPHPPGLEFTVTVPLHSIAQVMRNRSRFEKPFVKVESLLLAHATSAKEFLLSQGFKESCEGFGVAYAAFPFRENPLFLQKAPAKPGCKETIPSGSKNPPIIAPGDGGGAPNLQHSHGTSPIPKFFGERYERKVIFQNVSSPEEKGFSLLSEYVQRLHGNLAEAVLQSPIPCGRTEVAHGSSIPSQGCMKRGKKVF